MMQSFVLEQTRIDQGYNPSAQRLILIDVLCFEDLKPEFEASVVNEKGSILLVAVSLALQEPAFVWVWVFWVEARIQTLDNVPGETIIDPCSIIFTKEDPGFALRISDDVLPIPSRAGNEEGPL